MIVTNIIKCPFDNESFDVPGGDVNTLMRNYKLEAALESTQKASIVSGKASNSTNQLAESCSSHVRKEGRH